MEPAAAAWFCNQNAHPSATQGLPQFLHPVHALQGGEGVKAERVKRLGGVKWGDFLPGFIQNICFRHYSSYLGYFLRVCSYGNRPSMKDLFTGPWDKARPYVVNLEGAPSPPPVSSPSCGTALHGAPGAGDGRRGQGEMVAGAGGWLGNL